MGKNGDGELFSPWDFMGNKKLISNSNFLLFSRISTLTSVAPNFAWVDSIMASLISIHLSEMGSLEAELK